jgi:hypothetical protein
VEDLSLRILETIDMGSYRYLKDAVFGLTYEPIEA